MDLSSLKSKIAKFPNSPGVYIFRDKNRKIVYVGKATSLKDRVGSYFPPRHLTPSPSPYKGEGGQSSRPIEMMIAEVKGIEIRKTETVLEAYILEQELIKKFQPKYNVDGKDDKSFCYVVIAKEDFPRIMIIRKTELKKYSVIAIRQLAEKQSLNLKSNFAKNEIATVATLPRNDMKIYGPYASKKQIEIALKILRKIFPYHNKKENSEKECLDFQLGLCPGPYSGAISKRDYQKNIRGIKMILEGKKKNLLVKLKKEMAEYSKKEEFEKAGEIRNKIFALQHIRDVALISGRDEALPRLYGEARKMRIEGYDISNISGKFNVGSMVVFDNSEGEIGPNKNQYRKFKIKTVDGADDVGAMREILIRRFQNNWPASTRGGDRSPALPNRGESTRGWPLPNLILLDGGAGHLNMARKILKNYKLEIPLLAVAKGPERKKNDLRSFGNVPKLDQKIIEQIRDEAHRFAISYHRKLRGKEFKGGVDN